MHVAPAPAAAAPEASGRAWGAMKAVPAALPAPAAEEVRLRFPDASSCARCLRHLQGGRARELRRLTGRLASFVERSVAEASAAAALAGRITGGGTGGLLVSGEAPGPPAAVRQGFSLPMLFSCMTPL
mmetsp:Transcript_139342/g.444761  ORF Transcript_139342/g.444761 Transcript_139342/m.444761 type:complete len:128 (-) Transcript_139342:47-430(-)